MPPESDIPPLPSDPIVSIPAAEPIPIDVPIPPSIVSDPVEPSPPTPEPLTTTDSVPSSDVGDSDDAHDAITPVSAEASVLGHSVPPIASDTIIPSSDPLPPDAASEAPIVPPDEDTPPIVNTAPPVSPSEESPAEVDPLASTPAFVNPGPAPIQWILDKRLSSIHSKRQAKLDRLMTLFSIHRELKSHHVQKFLHIPRQTAMDYFDALEKEGKIRQIGTRKGAHYEKIELA